jgi:hypothetical protein
VAVCLSPAGTGVCVCEREREIERERERAGGGREWRCGGGSESNVQEMRSESFGACARIDKGNQNYLQGDEGRRIGGGRRGWLSYAASSSASDG